VNRLGRLRVVRRWRRGSSVLRRRRHGPKFVGIVTICVVAVVVGSLFVPTGLALGKVTYYAELSQSGGLGPGDEVRVAGVGVGEVKSLEVRDAKVQVTFRVGRSVRLGPATEATVKVATLLGNHFLELRPAGDGRLADRTIRLANTTVSFEVKDIIEAGGTALEELNGDKLREALKVLADDFRNTPALTRETVTGLARFSDVIVARQDQIGRLIRSANTVTANLNANREQLVALMHQASLILGEVTRRRAAIHELLVDAQALAAQLSGLVRDNQAKVAPLLAHLNIVLDTLRSNDAALGQALGLLGPASRYFANATGNGPYVDVVAPNAIFPDSTLCKIQAKC
jgi:phospholipid/cholesterol/gamma-HCH transport system substrate-binding protein